MSKNDVFGDFLKNLSLKFFHISYLDTSQHYLQLFYWSLSQENSSSPILRPKTVISYKKNQFFLIFSKNTVDTGFKLSRNVYQMIIYNFSIDTMLGKSRFLDLTAVNMRKKQFLAIFSTFFQLFQLLQLFTTFYNFSQALTTF